MKKEWPSFQRLMSLYGFKKRERASTMTLLPRIWTFTKNKNQAHYVHWENKFCRGHRDLLPQVKAPPKESTSTYPGTAPLAPDTHAVPQPQVETPPKESTSTYLGTIQEQPHAPNTTAAPQPLDWINPDAATSDLEEQLGMAQNKVAELDQQLLEKRLLEKRFMALDLGRLLEIKELEGKLEVAKLELEVAELIKVSESRARKVSVLERQLKDKDNLAKDLLAQRDVAFSIINGSTSFRPVPTSLWPNTPFPVRSFQEFEYNQTY
ncbi:hypothetical protein FRC04_001002 [Tulasnella sp. 424]|nr:hypothetical protein FRC04_001002 [Tulasnella sp. 424]KAG8977910.1 hypothetical protein FRC05_000438 [Tulasnella sp. 425]